MTTSKRIALASGLVLTGIIASAAGMAVAVSRRSSQDSQFIAPGVRVGDVAVGGLTPADARERVRAWAQAKMQSQVTFVAPISHRTWNITVADLGGRYKIDPALDAAFHVGKDESFWDEALQGVRKHNVVIKPDFDINEKLIDRQLARINMAIHQPAKNARAELSSAGAIEITSPEVKGIDVDVDATKAALLKNGIAALADGATVPLTIRETAPTVTAADLGQANSLLSSFHTGYNSSTPRAHNVELAASHINGTLLAPGEVFSYNNVVGPRTTELGWRDAPTYQDGQVVPGPGGGVCQVSTTLYNAVLRAGLKIVRRSHHSMPVHYVDAGRDATVAYGDIDFQFQNNTDGPVLITSRTNDGRLTFNLYGKTPTVARKIELASSDETPAADGGFTVTTYRVITDADGKVDRERLSTDTYAPYNPGSNPTKTVVKKKSVLKPKTGTPKATSPAPSAPAAVKPDAQPTPDDGNSA